LALPLTVTVFPNKLPSTMAVELFSPIHGMYSLVY
jgi:hypothetical protein